jgi:YcaO-like protein with predicted kinase domain
LARSLEGTVLKTFTRGTHRTASPDETLTRYGQLARRMGITRLGNVTGLDYIGIPIAVAVRPNSRSVSVSQGKGLTLTHALASAMMEAIEGFHGENLDSRFRMASARDLSAEACIVDYTRLCGTGRALPPTTNVPWIEGFDLLKDQPCWVPAEAVHLDFTLPARPGSGHFLVGGNGLASGNHLLEAVNSAICELVERDAAAIWQARTTADRARRRLDPGSVDDADCRSLLAAYEKAAMTVCIWNITSDVTIPAFVCDIYPQVEDPSVDLPRFRGAGCHPDRAVALARALTEAAQVRLTHITGIRDDLPPSAYNRSLLESLGAALLHHRSAEAEPCSFLEVPSFETSDLTQELRWELDRLRAVGIEQAVAVDLTQPEYGIPVVRIIIPGLEGNPSHPDYIPGPRARLTRGSTP